jgi:hypothetical protein
MSLFYKNNGGYIIDEYYLSNVSSHIFYEINRKFTFDRLLI